MNSQDRWKLSFQKEIQKAINARYLNNEGMARVCARRAAGIIIGEYFHRQGIADQDQSAYNRLQKLQNLPNTDEQVHIVAGYFLTRITPDHELPIEVDLLAEACWLSEKLLGE